MSDKTDSTTAEDRGRDAAVLASELPTAHELLVRALRSLDCQVAHRGARWAHVAEMFGLGSSYASWLCDSFDLDPDEQIGPTEWERLESALGGEDVELTVSEWWRVTGCNPPPEDERRRKGAGNE